MRNQLLLLLFVLLFTPTLSTAAVMRTLEIEFASPSSATLEQQILGYRLYRDGQQVCETSVPSLSSSITCDILTEDGTFNFTLAAYYSNDTESPQSPPFSYTIGSTPSNTTGKKIITYSWSVPDSWSVTDGIGYRMYMNNTTLCETTDRDSTSLSCIADLVNEPMAFSITSLYSNGTESQKSNILLLDPVSPLPITNVKKTITYSWSVADSLLLQDVIGHRMYMNNTTLCETTDRDSTSLSCIADLVNEPMAFSVTSLYSNGTESQKSNILLLDPTTVSEVLFNASVSGSESTSDIASYTSDLGGGSSVITALPSTAVTQPLTAIISSTTAAGNAGLVVDFDGTLSTSISPLVGYYWTFGDGSEATGETTSHSFTTTGTYSTTLTVVDSQGRWDSVSTPIIVTGSDSGDEVSKFSMISENNLNIEIGTVSIEHEWIKVYFENNFNNPIIITNPPQLDGSQPARVRIDNIDQEGFEMHMEEWADLADLPSFATVNYMVIEAGTYTLANGEKIEAGSFIGSTTSQEVILQETYDTAPVILTQAITASESDKVTSRVQDISLTSFKHLLQEQQISTKEPREERTDYIAWEPSQGEVFGLQYEIGIAGNIVANEWLEINFRTKFSDLPFFLADAQTSDNEDATTLRYQQLSQTTVQVKIEENQSFDSEPTYPPEVFGYFIIGPAQ